VNTSIAVGDDQYVVRPLLREDFEDLSRWRQMEEHGRWRVEAGGLIGEWVSDSPSLFLRQRIEGDFIWQVRATRVAPDEAFLRRFSANHHAAGAEALHKYNFNFWLRANTPDGEDFLEAYPRKLGTGWNGMGDDYWNSLFTTVVWNPDGSWVRLRRSPGYRLERDCPDALPHMRYGEPREFTFAVDRGRVRMYVDGRRIYDYAAEGLPEAGYIGLCVWLCKMRFEHMRIYQWL
jgi:hypothetical protein